MKPIVPLTERQKRNFWSKVHIGGSEDCWKWEGLISPEGYGRASFENKDYFAHRVAYFLYKGIDPGSNLVIQTCNNTSCCNPAHLQLKTRRGTLNESQVRHIKEQAAKGISRRALARQYAVGKTTIRDIILGKTWKDI